MRWLTALAAVGLAACEPLKDAFTARPDVAARAGGEVLSVERLSQLAGLSKQVPMQPEAIRRLAAVWVDYTLFALALADGRTLDDSATMVAAMWPAVAQLRWERFHDELVRGRTTLTTAQVDSAFSAGNLRLFQHILLRAPQSDAPQVVADKRTRLESVLRQARQGGARFAQLAAQYSEDPGSKGQGGVLGVAGRGAYVREFEEAAWALAPGGLSDVVRSPYGLHIIRRPPLAEVRDSFRSGVADRIAFHLDSVYADSVASSSRLRVAKNAPALVRQLVNAFDEARESDATLATYTSGRFRVRDLGRWVLAMEPQVAQGIRASSDSQLAQFVRVVSERHLLVEQATAAGTALTSEDWDYLRAVHDSALRTIQGVMGLDARGLQDSVATPDARRRIAVAHVEDYLDRAVQGRAQFVPIPPFFAEELRRGAEWSLSSAGLRRGLERARALRARQDSTNRTVTPAPGPAPIPDTDAGADTAARGGR